MFFKTSFFFLDKTEFACCWCRRRCCFLLVSSTLLLTVIIMLPLWLHSDEVRDGDGHGDGDDNENGDGDDESDGKHFSKTLISSNCTAFYR